MEPSGSVFCTLRIGLRKRTRANTRATNVTFTFRVWSGDRERAGHTRRVQYGTVLRTWYSRNRQRGTESGCETMRTPRFNFYFFSHSAPYLTSHTSYTAPRQGRVHRRASALALGRRTAAASWQGPAARGVCHSSSRSARLSRAHTEFRTQLVQNTVQNTPADPAHGLYPRS